MNINEFVESLIGEEDASNPSEVADAPLDPTAKGRENREIDLPNDQIRERVKALYATLNSDVTPPGWGNT